MLTSLDEKGLAESLGWSQERLMRELQLAYAHGNKSHAGYVRTANDAGSSPAERAHALAMLTLRHSKIVTEG